jgi:hypothetical protein
VFEAEIVSENDNVEKLKLEVIELKHKNQ